MAAVSRVGGWVLSKSFQKGTSRGALGFAAYLFARKEEG